MKLTRRSLTFMLAAAAFITPFAASATSLADIKSAGVLRVAVPQDFPPFGSMGPDMKLQGYDIDMAKLVAEKLGVKVQLVPVSSPNRIPFLQSNKADIVISTLGETPDRAKVIDFSKTYAPFILGVFGPKDMEVSTLDDLNGKTIGDTRGALEDEELSKVAPEGATIKRYEDNATTITAYLSGQTQLIATGNIIAWKIANEHPDKAPELKIQLKMSACKIGFAKNQPELEAALNKIVADAFSDGTLEALSQKWLQAPLPKNFSIDS